MPLFYNINTLMYRPCPNCYYYYYLLQVIYKAKQPVTPDQQVKKYK